MKKRILAGLLATTTVLAPAMALAETLIFGSGNVEQHPIVKRIFTPWVEKVNAEGGDALQIDMRHGQMLVNPGTFLDRLDDDVVQIVWGMPVAAPGRFPRSLVSTIPLIEGSSAAAAVAFCRMLENGDLGDEWADFVPLLIVPFPQVSAHLNGTPLTSMADIAGKKITTQSPAAAGIIQAYGGTPLSVNIQDQYQALQRGTADGTFMSYTAFPGFRLNEVTSDHLEVPLGGATGLAFMTRARFDGLSAEAKAVLTANSGCELAREVGDKVDQWEADSKGFVMSKEGHTFNKISEEGMAELKERVGETLSKGYAARVPGGAELIELWREQVTKADAE